MVVKRVSGRDYPRSYAQLRAQVFLRVLQLAIGHDPVRYRQLTKRPRPRPIPPRPPGTTGHPPSIDRPPAHQPWRSSRPRQSG